MTGICTCMPIRHAVTDEHRDALTRALDAAKQLGQFDLAEHYRYRLEPCPTANPKQPETSTEVTA